MRKIVKLVFFSLALFFSSCGKTFNFQSPNYVSKDKNQKYIDSFQITNESEVYLRKVYYELHDGKSYKLTTKPKDANNKKLVELQCFIFNKNQFVYITTIPSKHIYNKADTYLLKKEDGNLSYPNVFFFNNFFFGKLEDTTHLNKGVHMLHLKNNNEAQYWQVDHNGRKTFSIDLITSFDFKKVAKSSTQNESPCNKKMREVYKTTINTQYSTSEPLTFYKYYNYDSINYFHYLSYKNPKIQQSENASSPKCNVIYIVYADSCKKKVLEIIFPFDSAIKDGNNAVRFKGNRVKYLPF